MIKTNLDALRIFLTDVKYQIQRKDKNALTVLKELGAFYVLNLDSDVSLCIAELHDATAVWFNDKSDSKIKAQLVKGWFISTKRKLLDAVILDEETQLNI